MYCVKTEYFMMRTILNYVWENTISLYRMFEDQTSSIFSIFFGWSFECGIDLVWTLCSQHIRIVCFITVFINTHNTFRMSLYDNMACYEPNFCLCVFKYPVVSLFLKMKHRLIHNRVISQIHRVGIQYFTLHC